MAVLILQLSLPYDRWYSIIVNITAVFPGAKSLIPWNSISTPQCAIGITWLFFNVGNGAMHNHANCCVQLKFPRDGIVNVVPQEDAPRTGMSGRVVADSEEAQSPRGKYSIEDNNKCNPDGIFQKHFSKYYACNSSSELPPLEVQQTKKLLSLSIVTMLFGGFLFRSIGTH